jgi:hypothetical protein
MATLGDLCANAATLQQYVKAKKPWTTLFTEYTGMRAVELVKKTAFADCTAMAIKLANLPDDHPVDDQKFQMKTCLESFVDLKDSLRAGATNDIARCLCERLSKDIVTAKARDGHQKLRELQALGTMLDLVTSAYPVGQGIRQSLNEYMLKVKKESQEQALESAVMCDFSSLQHVEDLVCALRDHATQAISPDLAGHLGDARDLSYNLAYQVLKGDVTELTLKSACALWKHTASMPQLMQISGKAAAHPCNIAPMEVAMAIVNFKVAKVHVDNAVASRDMDSLETKLFKMLTLQELYGKSKKKWSSETCGLEGVAATWVGKMFEYMEADFCPSALVLLQQQGAVVIGHNEQVVIQLGDQLRVIMHGNGQKGEPWHTGLAADATWAAVQAHAVDTLLKAPGVMIDSKIQTLDLAFR